MNNRLSSFTQQAWIAVGFAFVIGLLIGWLLIGWALVPVTYTDADPWDLRPTAKAQWVAMVADSYSLNNDLQLAQQRLRGFSASELNQVAGTLIQEDNRQGKAADAQRLLTFAKAYGLNPSNVAGGPAPTVTPRTTGSDLLTSLGPLLLVILLLIVIGAAAVLVYSRFKTSSIEFTSRVRETVSTRPETYPQTGTAIPVGASVGGGPTAPVIQPPLPRAAPVPSPRTPATPGKSLGTFAATYKFGDDSYDTAFTLETPRSEFLGECGMGISETIGEGKPDKVTAFDLWLFDKTDVRTVTNILMSEHAYNDQALRGKLAPKGELVLAEKGKHLVLETATLRVEAEIVDLVYASTPGLASNSHFQKLTVEMNPVQK